METTAQWINLTVPGSNTPMEGYLAQPKAQGSYPGVVVLMEIFGVNAHIRSVTEKLAAEGYVALAINYYHRSTPNLELGYTEETIAEGQKHKNLTTREGLLADVQAATDFLKTQPNVSPTDSFGTIGFCYGGHVSFLAAALPDVKASINFYGAGLLHEPPYSGKAPIEYAGEIHGDVLCIFAEFDDLIPLEEVAVITRRLRENNVRFGRVIYPEVGHGFMCDQRNFYDKKCANDANRIVRNFLRSVFHPKEYEREMYDEGYYEKIDYVELKENIDLNV